MGTAGQQPRTPREGEELSGYIPPRKGWVAAVIFLGVGKTGTPALHQPPHQTSGQQTLQHASERQEPTEPTEQSTV